MNENDNWICLNLRLLIDTVPVVVVVVVVLVVVEKRGKGKTLQEKKLFWNNG